MVDIKYLKKLGICSQEYKKIFTMPPEKRPPQLQKLFARIKDRVYNGRSQNLKDYRIYAAIDLAYELPFNQTTPTILQSIVAQHPTPEQARDLLKSWGLSEETLFLKVDVSGATKLIPNPPVFYNVLVPLVKAYATIRAAKIYNDRNRSPLLPYKPLKNITEDRVICQIITDLMESISTSYGYPAVLREGINTALKYGVALAFPREEWHCDRAEVEEDGVVARVTAREGLRYHFSHPSRMGWDLMYPLPTINTDTGCEYAYHWRVLRYGDVLDNREYWNRNMISYGTNWFEGTVATNYFKEVYPCQLKFPGTMGSVTETREDRVAAYTSSDRDAAIFVTEHFEKIVPLHYGLGPYKYPVWHRFTVAADDTIIWAGPCAYNPLWAIAYDYDANAAHQSSFALECIPWQDHLGNILSQMMLSIKQNLINIVYYDTNMVEKDEVDRVKNLGEGMFKSINFLPFDSLKMQRAGINVANAFMPVQMPWKDVSQLSQMMAGALNIMERVLQMSAQEVGAAAQHYQSAKEISVTQTATSTRLSYTGSFVDDAMDAWKRQLYDAAMAYKDTDVLAEIESDIPNLPQILGQLGFENKFQGKGVYIVQGKKDALRIEGFSRKDNEDLREENMSLAQIMYQTVQSVSSNPELFNQIGAENVLKLLEEAAKLSGAPATFKLKLDPEASPGGIQAQLAQMLQESQKGIMEFISKQVMEPAAKNMAQSQQKITTLEETVKQLLPIFKVAQAQVDKNQAAVAEAQQRMQIKQAEFQAEQQRKQQAHELEMQRKVQTTQADVAMQSQRMQADLQGKAATVQTDVQIRSAEAAAQAQIDAAQAEQDAALKRQTTQTDIDLKRQMSEATIENKKAESRAKAKAAAKKPAKSGA